MANEVFTRTPTSSGNRKTFTWAGWIKRNSFNSQGGNFFQGILGVGTVDGAEDTFTFSGDNLRLRCEVGTDIETTAEYRDSGNWIHVMMVVNTTLYDPDHRCIFYVNGVKSDVMTSEGDITQNADLRINSTSTHYLGEFPRVSEHLDGQITDVFFVDGQALTPDVFGFYKDRDGYISVGSTQATDFRPGQWMPHSPSIIKKSIERSGGFGVNGFYLPMNDSSNPGADFHCAPNSIITLKGEDLPQPRNGAPTTTDAYVSQLRSDSYAANLVLAVPGISTSTSANLITNGNFDSSDISDWVTNTSSQTWVNGQLQVTRSGGAGATTYKTFTTEVGKRYTVLGTVNSSGSRGDINIQDGTGWGGSTLLHLPGTNGEIRTMTGSFTAASTTTTFGIGIDNNGTTIYVDNIVVKQEDAPRDYSADIKGSGSNLTATVNNNAGVGYELGNYYGSALNFNTTGDHMRYAVDGTDYGTNDFTFECWAYVKSVSNWTILMTHATNGTWDNGITLVAAVNTVRKFGAYISNGTTDYTVTSGAATANYALNQWHHVAVERYGNYVTLYVNGVAEGVQEVASTYDVSVLGTPGSNSAYALSLSAQSDGNFNTNGYIQDLRVYKGVAKYKGGFDVPKPYTPVGIEAFRTTADTCKNNFTTLNPLIGAGTALNDNVPNLKDGNLYYDIANQSWTISTIGVSSGKYYAEFMLTGGTLGSNIGVCGDYYHGVNNEQYHAATGISYIRLGNVSAVKKNYNASSAIEESDSNFSYESGCIVSVTIDFDNKEIKYYKNGTLIRTDSTPASYTPVDSAFYFLTFRTNDGASPIGSAWSDVTANFGQNPSFSGQTTAGTFTDDSGKGLFKYAPPTGFLALCEDNLPTPAIADPGDYMRTVLYTGSQTARSIQGLGFKPDLVWIKARSETSSHVLYDSVRGPAIGLFSNRTDAEETDSNNLTSFDNNGFSLGTGYSSTGVNGDGRDYVAWCWKAGGAAVSNTDGTITSQVSANQTAGFSIVSYTGTGANATVGHGLNKKPKMVIVKRRDAATNWPIWFEGVSTNTDQVLQLNLTTGSASASTFFNSSNTTTTSFPLGNGGGQTNASGSPHIAYCWAEIEGFSKFGSYVGNGSADGPFCYCGFRPAFVMIKRTDSTGEWWMYDSSRGSTNPNPRMLLANSSGTENEDSSSYLLDFLSNGFKWRSGLSASNGNGGSFIFAAFAESPFQTANSK